MPVSDIHVSYRPVVALRRWIALTTVLVALLLAGCADNGGASGSTATQAPQPTQSARIGHVFIIVLENKDYDKTFGANSAAPYLAQTLPADGALLENYYATGHVSLDNYISLISGQAPNLTTQTDCQDYINFTMLGKLNANGQAVGQGCVYPTQVPALPDQFKTAGVTWKGYMDEMGNDPSRYDPALAASAARPQGPRTCGHPKLGGPDGTQKATAKDQYATRHDPFMYFHSVIDNQAYCDQHVVNLQDQFKQDLQSIATTPQYSFITPDLCNDGHDASCADGETGGLTGINRFLKKWVPVILNAPAFKKDGLLIITFDESDGPQADSTACCGEKSGPNTLLPGLTGPGGGRIGAVLLSPFIKPGTVSKVDYNHYSTLRTIERIFGLPYLGFAAAGDTSNGTACDNSSQPCSFGADVFSRKMPIFPAR